MGRIRIRALAVTAICAIALVGATAALAAKPKAGKSYKGCTSEAAINGFCAPVTFKVSKAGGKLLAFTWAGIASCGGAGGFGQGDPWKGTLLHRLGAVIVKHNGHFSVKHVENVYKFNGGYTEDLFSTVSGKFGDQGKLASGTVTWRETDKAASGQKFSCGPIKISFSASPKAG